MNFEESIQPLTTLLIDNGFLITEKSLYRIDFSSSFAFIRVVYADLEQLYDTYIGQNKELLSELTPDAIKGVFNDSSFQFQSTLTIDNLISFLTSSGHAILLGDKLKLEELAEFSKRQSKEYTKMIIHRQNIQLADTAWIEENYADFITFIDKTEKALLSQSYLKKYNIALGKLRRRTK